MKLTNLPIVVLLFLLSTSVSAGESITMNNLVVTVIDQVDVPARETGMLETLSVREGDHVTAGQTIGNLDSRQVELQAKLAQADLRIAMARVATQADSRLAKQDLALAQELAKQQQIAADVAGLKAENDARVRAATKATAIAKNEWSRANDARSRFADSVSKSELDSLRLGYERSQLETQQAALEQKIEALGSESSQKESLIHRLQIRRAEVTLEQAESEAEILQIQTAAKQHAAKLADLAAKRHLIVAPFDGVIAQRYQRAGQWVQQGMAIVRLLRLSRLQAEGFFDAATALRLRDAKSVTLRCDQAGDIELSGSIAFVSPEVDPVNGQVRVLIEFDNPGEKVLPGMRVDLSAVAAPELAAEGQ